MKAQESRKIPAAGFLIMGVVLAIALLFSWQNSLVAGAQDPSDELVLPITDYDVPEPLTAEDKAKRLKRNKRRDHQSGEAIKEAPYPVERIWSAHWARGVPAIPASQSDLVLIGTVTNSQAYLSADKTGVYSEFEIRVEEILKGVGIAGLNSPSVSVERFGGAVRFSSGVVQRYLTNGQGMPREGRRYLLFLKTIEGDDDFFVLTGYELRERIVPLDGSSQKGNLALAFDSYKGADVDIFLKAVRDAIVKASVVSSK